jgi:transposase
MIIPSGGFRIFLASEPVDFRKGMDGLVAHIAGQFDLDPFDGAIWIFRSRRADRLKLIVWDGTGLVLVLKRLEDGRFVWPKPQSGLPSGPLTLSKVQFEALFAGMDWRNLPVATAQRPVLV